MKRFILSWTEKHEVEVEASDVGKAWDLAYDDETSLKATIHNEVLEVGQVDEEENGPDGMHLAKMKAEDNL